MTLDFLKSGRRRYAVLLAVLIAYVPAHAATVLDEKGRVKLVGDFRFRLERDWDSQDAAGVERDDRNRTRLRARVGMEYDPSENLSFGVRFRTGPEGSQQSAFLTLFESENDGPNDSQVDMDRWYAAVRKGGAWGWAGRNDFPFWGQDEWLWDADVTLAGVAGGWRHTRGNHRLDLSAGYFSVPDGMTRMIGNLAAGQAVWSGDAGRWGFTTAAGAFAFSGEDGAVNLLNGNGSRDYEIAAMQLQGRLKLAERWPVSVGVDLFRNVENYSPADPDPFTVAHRDDKEGWVATASAGQQKEKGDWLFAVWYARIEALALNASFIQDDWTRWGNANQIADTDLKGWELRGVYTLTPRIRVMGRLYLADAITSAQDGRRFRLDIGYDF